MVEPVTFRPAPVQAPVETPPKRGPGRPPTVAARPSARSLKSEISATLMQINLVLIMIPPLRQDQMDMVEIDALASSLDEQARKSPRFRKALEGALTATGGAGLISILAIIGTRRAARHGLVPVEIDQQLGNLLAQGSSRRNGAS